MDEAITLLSPLDVALVAAKELVEALAEVLNSLLNIFRDGMSALGHQLHGDHICNGDYDLLSGLSEIFGILLSQLLCSLMLLSLVGIVQL